MKVFLVALAVIVVFVLVAKFQTITAVNDTYLYAGALWVLLTTVGISVVRRAMKDRV